MPLFIHILLHIVQFVSDQLFNFRLVAFIDVLSYICEFKDAVQVFANAILALVWNKHLLAYSEIISETS